jgi:hypothetical protein
VKQRLELRTVELELWIYIKDIHSVLHTFSDLHYIQGLVSPGLVQQIMPYLLLAYSTNGSLDT